MEKRWVIYKHTLLAECEHKGWSYIGLTSQKNLNKRWRNGNGYRPVSENYTSYFWNAIQMYGWDAFSHEILEENIETSAEANKR